MNTQSMLPVGTMLRGIYRIESYLASGGFGNTYVVRNVEFDEVYALKEFYIKGVCQREGDSTTISVSNAENKECFMQQREKFKKEARRIRNLDNEHIVKVHDLFEENGTAYYIMDLVDGESLASRIKRTNQPLTETEVNVLLPQMLDGLKAIHDMGIWHLDIKPANIMVDKHGAVKIIDFGASKQQSSNGGATMSTGISYTNGYAPAEQMAQTYEDFGPWTDFYALGATLYKLLTLQNPPSVTRVAEDETPDKHEALPMPGVSYKMKQLVVWMMQDKRKRRPQSAAEISERLSETKTSQDDETTVVGTSEETTVIGAQPKLHGSRDTANSAPNNTVETSQVHLQSTNKKGKLRIVIWVVIAFVVIAGIEWLVMFKYNEGNAETHPEIAETSDLVQIIDAEDDSYISFSVNGVSFDMVGVEAGTFTMGATSEQGSDAWDNEKPTHQVTLIHNYYIGKTEVTQALWKAVMGSNPSNFKGDNLPVECVSWNDCQTFISKLNAATGKRFRLPTEAEWEFAARGGKKSKGYKYSGSNNLDNVAWYDGNSSNKTHTVGTKIPNELGIYDMSGNVWEWCSDWYGNYSSSSQTNPTGPNSGSLRVDRGGGWIGDARYCRSSYRYGSNPVGWDYFLGLRLVLSE